MSDAGLRFLTVANGLPDPNSGAAGTVWHTNVALRELGHDVDEIWAEQLGPRRITHGNLHSLLEQPRAYRREVLKAVASKHYDVVMMSQPQAYVAAKALKQSGFRGVVINRSHGVELRADAVLPQWHRKLGVPESRFPPLTRLFRRFLQRQWQQIPQWCDGIIVPSEMDRECLLQQTPAQSDQVRTIHHGVSNAFLSPPSHSPPPDEIRFRRLLYVGQYAFIKGPDILIAVANQILRDSPNVTLTWVTTKSAHKAISKQIDPAVREQVTLLDWIANENLVTLYDQHGIFLFPSFMEGAGKASLEAMSRGLCVIASDTGGMRDYVKNGENGFLCEVGNNSDFCTIFRNVIADVDLARSVVRFARESVGRMTWTYTAKRIAEWTRTFAKPQLTKSHDISKIKVSAR